MLDNDKLNRRLKKIFKELKDRWRLTPYRIAVETGIPHSSLKYMVDAKFEWKLNHMLAVIDFLNRYGVKTSLSDLLDFSEKKSFDKIFNTEKADFRVVIKNARKEKADKPERKKAFAEIKPLDYKKETELLTSEISEVVKENLLYKKSKIVVGIRINGKDINFQKEIKL
jgi:hypothetical protein